jgi:uncharacterized tellurite resistance protein B-like protein
MKSILNFLGIESQASEKARNAAQTEAVRQITEELEHLPPDKARYVAKFAYILSRVANADLKISHAETREMERIVREVGGLPEEQAVVVVHAAKTRNLVFGGTDNFLVTREFNNVASREEKLRLLDCLFAVSAAEDGITTVEDNEIRQVSKELLLEHRDYIAVRIRHKEHLAVLQDLPTGKAGSDAPEG